MSLYTAVKNFPQEKLFNSLNYYEALIQSKCLNQKNDWKINFFMFDGNGFKVISDFELIKKLYIYQPHKVILPAYIRFKSNDDFSHDHDLINAYERSTQKKYYPKLQICTPYMPIEGSDFFYGTENKLKKEYILKVLQWALQNDIKSVHFTLPDKSEYAVLKELSFFSTDKQLGYWINKNYTTFHHFLSHLKSKYRAQINKERQHIADCGYTSLYVQGNSIKEMHLDVFFKLFQSTHKRKNWLMSKLNYLFFINIWKRCSKNMVLFFLKKGDVIIASSCAFLHGDTLCGRFWGSLHDNDYIHFEIMYYALIEYAILKKIPTIEIGFSNLHKVIRGFDVVQAKNFHKIFDFDENSIKKEPLNHVNLFKTAYK